MAGEQPSLDLAMKIAGLTNNQVRPQDFKEFPMTKTLDTVEEAIKAMADGELVVVVDDDDRENEGDLIGAAAKISPEQMALMVRHTSGMCATNARRRGEAVTLDRGGLNERRWALACPVSSDYRWGWTTGISEKERCARAACDGTRMSSGRFVRARPSYRWW